MRIKVLSGRTLVLAALVVSLTVGTAGIGSVYAIDYGAPDFGVGTPDSPEEQEANVPEPGLSYLFAVYIITWAAFFSYVFVMSRRLRDMRQDLEALRKALADRERQSAQREQHSPAN